MMDLAETGGGSSMRTPDAVAPPPRHPRFPLLDGLRAVAVGSVVLFHSAVMGGATSGSLFGRLVEHLNVGVTIFFLLSGFLLYRPFIARRTGGAPAPATVDYFKRRILRIFPAYWLALVLLIILPGLTGTVNGNLPTMFVFLQHRCFVEPFSCRLAQAWSLQVEASFYVVLPLYVLGMRALTRQLSDRAWMRLELAVLAGLSLASMTLRYVILNATPVWMGASAFGNIVWFAAGMGLAVVSVAYADASPPWVVRTVSRRPGSCWLMAGAIYLALSLWLPANPFLAGRAHLVATELAFALISALLLAPIVFPATGGGVPGRFLSHRITAWLGLISYGIFLWHYAIALSLGSLGAGDPFVVVLAGTVAISIATASASYYLVERPVLRLKYRPLGSVLPYQIVSGWRQILAARPGGPTDRGDPGRKRT